MWTMWKSSLLSPCNETTYYIVLYLNCPFFPISWKLSSPGPLFGNLIVHSTCNSSAYHIIKILTSAGEWKNLMVLPKKIYSGRLTGLHILKYAYHLGSTDCSNNGKSFQILMCSILWKKQTRQVCTQVDELIMVFE